MDAEECGKFEKKLKCQAKDDQRSLRWGAKQKVKAPFKYTERTR